MTEIVSFQGCAVKPKNPAGLSGVVIPTIETRQRSISSARM
jgi:hypothetical protein